MKTRVLALIIFSALYIQLNAQSIWNASHLSEVKSSLTMPAYLPAYNKLMEDAGNLMNTSPLSVMMKDKTPASGNKHDYMSQARYFWPDPSKPDGKPYIRRDGVSNPELEKLDRVRLGLMADRVITLSLAWYFSGNESYARKATEQIRAWFINKDSRMNPNLNFAQVVPGQNNDKGRCYGVLDTYSLVEMLDAVQLLENSGSFTTKDSRNLKKWVSDLLHWILTSDQGIEESKQVNNHGVAYDAQVIAFALYAGRNDIAEQYLRDFPRKRVFDQIDVDGKQPRELSRTLSYGYSVYNLQHITDVFMMGKNSGMNIDESASSAIRFYKAVDFLIPFTGKEVNEWPYQQISEWYEKQNDFLDMLYRIYTLNTEKKEYLKTFRTHKVRNWSDRFNLLYLKADDIENTFAFADQQLRYAIDCVKERKAEHTDCTVVSPRTVEKDGTLRLVRARDWCSGFFPGSLWQTFHYNKGGFWREQAVSHTWPIEQIKYHKGTHDLGFMIFCPFGQAYKLTGEQSFRDVALTAANTLAGRYSDKVKAIRSWDWNRKVWQFPVIIDNMMNLELLFWAAKESGDSVFHHIAVNHANTTMKNHFRADHSSYHVVNYDSITGKPITRVTHQGINDESSWSRGQAWGLYGFTMCYRFTKDPAYLQMAQNITDFFFNQPGLPDDLIPYWDMRDPAIPESPRDASAAALIASGLYELSSYINGDKAVQYRKWADSIVHNLTNRYMAQPGTSKGFILLHSTGNYPSKDEVDAPISYADYYFLEAVLRKADMGNY